MLLSPEGESTVRGKRVMTPNLNVLFEFGYFYGHFGPERVAILRYGDFYLPSDLDGYIHISGSKSFRRSAAVKVGKRTVTDFGRWISSAHFEAPSNTKKQVVSVPTSEEVAIAKQEKLERDQAVAKYRNARKQPINWRAR